MGLIIYISRDIYIELFSEAFSFTIFILYEIYKLKIKKLPTGSNIKND